MGKTQSYEAIQPVGDNFRELPTAEAFTWADGVPIGAHGLCAVNFLSHRILDADPRLIRQLLRLDVEATEEAEEMPGFGKYWHDDELSPEKVGSSFCLWESYEQALIAAGQPKHRAAVEFAKKEGKNIYHYYIPLTFILDRPVEEVVFTPVERKPIIS